MAIRGGFQIAEAYVELILDKDAAKRGVRELPRELGPDADRAGKDTGNVLSRGIRLSIIRNSPIIAAAIAGAVAVGAPLLLAGAGVLFAGVGALAAAQSDRVRSSWVGAFQSIKTQAVADAAVMVPVVSNMAARMVQSFESLRPSIAGAFSAAAPQLEGLTVSTLRAAEAITGGLIRAVEGGAPVMAGFGEFLERVGEGTAEMFDAMTAHAPAAGSAWRSLGEVFGALLPLLGELLGTGVELASIVLPALGSSLQVVLGAARLLGPALPALVSGFAGLRMAQTAQGYLRGFAQSMAFASYGTGPFASAAGRASGAVGALSKALPAAGIALALVSTQMADQENRANAYAQAMIAGGAATRQAAADSTETWLTQLPLVGAGMSKVNDLAGTWGGTLIESVPILGSAFDFLTTSEEEAGDAAKKAYDDMLAAMDPVQRARVLEAQALANLKDAIDQHGRGSSEAAAAQEEYSHAADIAARAAADEEMAIRGVTDAMLAQADAASARANSDIAYRQALDSTEDAVGGLREAMDHLNDANEDTRTSQEDVSRAGLEVEAAFIKQAEAAGKLAFDALPATMREQDRNAQAARASLAELENLRVMFGGTLPANLETYRLSLERIAGGMNTTQLDTETLRSAFEDLGVGVQAVAANTVRLHEPTVDLTNRLRDLGFTIEGIPGSKDVIVRADSQQAFDNMGALRDLLAGFLGGAPYAATVTIDDQVTTPLGEIWAWMGEVDNTSVDIRATLDNDQFVTDIAGSVAQILGLSDLTASPTATLADAALNAGMQVANQSLVTLDNTAVSPTAGLDTTVGTQVDGDLAAIWGLDRATAYPVATLIDVVSGAAGRIVGVLGGLGGQRPTPVATLIDGVSGPARNAAAAINAIQSRTVTITTINRSINEVQNITSGWLAGGGNIGAVVRGFAAGGAPGTGGKVRGPGSMFDDLIAAVTAGGEPIRVSNDEWIIRGLSSQQYGDKRMAAVNDGTAVVLAPDEVRALRGFLDGGLPAGSTVTAGSGSTTIAIDNVTFEIKGIFDFTKPAESRRLAYQLVDLIRSIERERA